MFIERFGQQNPFHPIKNDGPDFAHPEFVDTGNGYKILMLSGQRSYNIFNGTMWLTFYEGVIKSYAPEGGDFGPYERIMGDANPFQMVPKGTHKVDSTFLDLDGNGTHETLIHSYNQHIPKVPGPIGDPIIEVFQLNQEGIYKRVNNNPFGNLNGDANFYNHISFGDDQLLVQASGSSDATLYQNNGGNLQPVGTYKFADVNNLEIIDFNMDGELDVFVENPNGTIDYWQSVNGKWEPQTGAGNPFNGIDAGTNPHVAFEDLDLDGDLDAVVANQKGEVRYYENTTIDLNEAPVAVGDFVQTYSDSPVDIDIIGNDLEFDGDPLTLTNFDGTTALGGTVILNQDGTLKYTAPADIASTQQDTFTYTIEDATGLSATATVTVTITPRLFKLIEGDDNPFKWFDVGAHSAPELADIDGDGDYDLWSGNGGATVNLFANNNGTFVEQFEHPLSDLKVGKYGGDSHLTFADFDGDGDKDLFPGSSYYNKLEYYYYENVNGTFVQRKGDDNPIERINYLGSHHKGEAFDWDSNGRTDLIVADSQGTIRFFRNEVDANGDFSLQEVPEEENPFRQFNLNNPDLEKYVSPLIIEIDGDRYFLAGNRFGKISGYRYDAANARWLSLDENEKELFGGLLDTDVGMHATLAKGDIDGDGDEDIVVGNKEGKFLLWENQSTGTTATFPFAGDGNNNLNGGAGDEILNGGKATNVLAGGAGAEQFNFISGEELDIVSDFQNGQDVIGLASNISFSQLEIVPYSGHTGIWSNVSSEGFALIGVAR